VTGPSLGAFDECSAPFWHAALDSLPDSLAVLDHHGDVLAVNETWRRFAERSAAPAIAAVVERRELAPDLVPMLSNLNRRTNARQEA